MRLFLLFLLFSLSSAHEHWFVFDQNQFPGFYTPLFTLVSASNNKADQQEERKISFALSAYDRAIYIDINIGNSTKTIKRDDQLIKLNIERADLLHNSLNHLIFIALKQGTRVETYVNCKLIDSYLLYPSYLINDNTSTNKKSNDEDEDDEIGADDEDNESEEDPSFKIENLAKGIKHLNSKTDENYHQRIFEKFGCKQAGTILHTSNKTTFIGRPLIRKMQHVIEKVQKRKLRSR